MPSSATRLFVRPVKCGNLTIRRPLVFYIGLNKVGTASTARLILQHGGRVVAHPEGEGSNVIPLVDPQSKTRQNCRTAYSVEYIRACVEQNKLLDVEEFRLKPTKTPGPKTVHSRLKKRKSGRERTVPGQVAKPVPHANDVPAKAEGTPGAVPHKPTEGRRRRSDKQQPQRPQASNEKSTPAASEPTQDNPPQVQLPDKPQKNKKLESEGSPRSPPNAADADVQWTPLEDKLILDMYADAIELFKRNKEDTARARSLRCWVTMGSTGVLPDGRTPQECLDRVLELEKIRELRKKKLASVQSTTRELPTQAAQESNSDEDKHGEDQPEAPVKGRKSPDAHGSTTAPALKPARGKSFKSQRRRTSEKTKASIRRIVAALAVRGNVSERRAFCALRAEEGNWKKALRAIIRNKKRENAS